MRRLLGIAGVVAAAAVAGCGGGAATRKDSTPAAGAPAATQTQAVRPAPAAAAATAPSAARRCVDQSAGKPADVLLCVATAHVPTAMQVQIASCLKSATGAHDVSACMRKAAG